MSILHLLFIIIVGYLIGSIPNAYFVTLFVKRINIFEVGSGNMGGTNVARTLGLPWGIFTSVLDSLKGILSVVVAQYLMVTPIMLVPPMATGLPEDLLIPSMVAALAAVAGHNWSLFATLLYMYYQKKFEIRGGKGAATAFGTMLVMLPVFPNILLLVVGIAIALATRYASLSVLVCFSVAFLWVIGWAYLNEAVSMYYILYAILLAVLIAWRFRENIERLLAGNERKLGDRVAS
ncbi:MAG: glycerol-3-phosphate 1-O-acyltransferase PlsY [Phototrophicaceae bacterium]